MTKPILRKLVLGFTPLLLTILLAVYLRQSELQDSVLQIRLGLDTTSVIIGAVVSALLLSVLFFSYRSRRRLRGAIELEKEQSRVEHRRFIQRLDHELKNPLTAIRLGIENIRSLNPGVQFLSDVESIESQSQRLVRLTGDLRKVGIFDNQELDREEVNVGELLRDIEEMGKEAGLLVDRRVELILPSAPWPVPNIFADRDLLQLALYNLLDNAVKYSTGGDTVEIRATEDGSYVRIVVADTGLGIGKGDVSHIWDELFRGKNARHQSGSGIGLSLVKRIIDRHGGRISVDSKENTGTRITILLPIASM